MRLLIARQLGCECIGCWVSFSRWNRVSKAWWLGIVVVRTLSSSLLLWVVRLCSISYDVFMFESYIFDVIITMFFLSVWYRLSEFVCAFNLFVVFFKHFAEARTFYFYTQMFVGREEKNRSICISKTMWTDIFLSDSECCFLNRLIDAVCRHEIIIAFSHTHARKYTLTEIQAHA